EAPLDKVQNVNLNQGIVGNALGFGRLVIETAAAVRVSRVVFDHLPQQAQVQQLIFEQMRRVRAGEVTANRQLIREKLESSVGMALHATIPRPVIPADEPPPAPAPRRPGLGERLANATVRQLFWIEQRSPDRITWRKHWLRLLAVIWMPLLTLVGLAALLILYIASPGDKSPLLIALVAGLGVAAFFWLWWNWVNWGNDQYIVTNDRIIDTEKLPLGFSSKRTETTFDKIQNVSFSIPGPVAYIFDYGTVNIYTAGAQGRLDFSWIKDPRGVQQEIFRRLGEYEDRQRRQRREEQWEMLPDWFAAYDESRRRN
ncbi:MAG TPA: PH domain-containing protein, partial [Anaerolineae bacterium]|nr:PH domain-containing protein [Anaerolineae bacterium]